MKKYQIFLIILIIPLLSSVHGRSQVLHYDVPENDSYHYPFLFPIGWSDDGKKLAYGIIEFNANVNLFEKLTIYISDLVKDSIVWQLNKYWEKLSDDDFFPESNQEAVSDMNKSLNINEKLWEQGITITSPEAVYFKSSREIQLNDDTLTVESVNIESNDFSSIYNKIFVTSKKLGEKIVASGELPIYRQGIGVTGYIFNPARSRVALICILSGGAEYDDESFIVGCHLKAGFKMTGK